MCYKKTVFRMTVEHPKPQIGGLNSNLFATPVSQSRQLSAANTEDVSCEIGSAKYYALCGFGGLLSCGITHTAVTPLDLVKCRLQVNKEKYKNLGNGFKVSQCLDSLSGLAQK